MIQLNQQPDSEAHTATAEKNHPKHEAAAADLAVRTSLLAVMPGFVLIAIAVADSLRFTDPDLWGHIRFGQATLAAHLHPILRDPYSYTAFGHPWRNHEWLTEVIMALCWNGLGVFGLKLWKFACAAGTIVLLALGALETCAAPTVQMQTITIAALALMPQMQFRPQLFTFLLFAALLAILARQTYRGAAPLWLAIPMMAVWANLHGGFIIGIASLAAYLGITAIEDVARGRGLCQALRIGAITAGATIATLVTPYGIGSWLAVTHALANPMTRRAITDWQPLLFAMKHMWHTRAFGVVYYLCVLAMMAAVAITFALKPRGGDLPLVAIAAIMSAAAFASVRNMPLAVIACTAPLCRHAGLVLAQIRRDAGVSAAPAPATAARMQFVAAAVAIALLGYTGLFSNRLETDFGYPSGAVAFMHSRGLKGNLLGDFAWGEYLIWHAPASRVFIDGRYDTVYPERVIDDYVNFQFNFPGASGTLNSYPNDFVLIPPGIGADVLMQKALGWKLIYEDRDSLLYARAGSPATRINGVPAHGSAAQHDYFP